jgi:hypothetical protein
MDTTQAKEILDKVVGAVFGYKNPFTLDEALEKFAFDLRLPQQIFDSTTSEPTWAVSINPSKFMTSNNIKKRGQIDDWMLPKRDINSVEDIIVAWAETNFTTTERVNDSINVGASDHVLGSENIYRSTDLRNSKNVIFTEGGQDLEYVVAGSRSQTSSFCIRVEDSKLVSNSFNVLWSAKVTNSFFVQDSYDLMDCMFCSHLAGKRFCIANMQFDEDEYNRIKEKVIHWILTN